MTRLNTQFSVKGISLLNSVMALSSSVQFKKFLFNQVDDIAGNEVSPTTLYTLTKIQKVKKHNRTPLKLLPSMGTLCDPGPQNSHKAHFFDKMTKSWCRLHRTCFYTSWSLRHLARDVSPIIWTDYTRYSEPLTLETFPKASYRTQLEFLKRNPYHTLSVLIKYFDQFDYAFSYL